MKRNPDGSLRKFLDGVQPSDDCIIWPFTASNNGSGYPILSIGGKMRYAHRVICEKFNGPPPKAKLDAAHSCGNRGCVNPRHLRWSTRSENHFDKRLHGTDLLGEKSPNAKLTKDAVMAIRDDRRSESVIAKEFGVCRQLVGKIRRREAWSWLQNASQTPADAPPAAKQG